MFACGEDEDTRTVYPFHRCTRAAFIALDDGGYETLNKASRACVTLDDWAAGFWIASDSKTTYIFDLKDFCADSRFEEARMCDKYFAECADEDGEVREECANRYSGIVGPSVVFHPQE